METMPANLRRQRWMCFVSFNLSKAFRANMNIMKIGIYVKVNQYGRKARIRPNDTVEAMVPQPNFSLLLIFSASSESGVSLANKLRVFSAMFRKKSNTTMIQTKPEAMSHDNLKVAPIMIVAKAIVKVKPRNQLSIIIACRAVFWAAVTLFRAIVVASLPRFLK